jgi:ferrous iron transport protein B
MSTHRIAIIGNPNCGKTTLFNKLTGSHQKVGNWAGVTVDKKTGVMSCENRDIDVVDLPGVYSLSVATQQHAVDELIACRYITNHRTDLYINILDAANLQRNLYLTLQLLEMNVPVILALNMSDIAKKRKITIDEEKLSAVLGCPVVSLVSTKAKGIVALKQAILQYQPKKRTPFSLGSSLESHITDIEKALPSDVDNQRWRAIRLLEKEVFASEQADEALRKKVGQSIEVIEQTMGEETDILFADKRYQLIAQVIDQAVLVSEQQKTMTMRVDSVVMNRALGIPIFLLVMYLIFEISIGVGVLLQPLFNISSSVIFIGGVNYLGGLLHLPAWLVAIFSQGIGLGINTVLNFVPQIGLMFLCLSFLEDSGYMARAAFVMDRFMQMIGLPGKAFIPLIVGFGCNVPSILSARTLDDHSDRVLTAMMSPFMSCGARLAIFVVFASAFYPHHGGLVVFALYLFGIGIAMLTGFLLKKTLLKGCETASLMEIPSYHAPHGKTIARMTWQRLKRFIFRAGKIIIPISMLVGTLNAVDFHGHVYPQGARQSILAQAGKAVTPLFSPMGVTQNNWPATVGLMTGVLAKEVVIGSLNTLYTQNRQKEHPPAYHFWQGLALAVTTTVQGFERFFSQQIMNPLTANEADRDMSHSAMGRMAASFGSGLAAFAYLLFVLLYVPCISTMSVIAREAGKGWMYGSIMWSTSIAYTVAVVFYQGATFAVHPVSSFFWIAGLLFFQVVMFKGLRRYSRDLSG